MLFNCSIWVNIAWIEVWPVGKSKYLKIFVECCCSFSTAIKLQGQHDFLTNCLVWGVQRNMNTIKYFYFTWFPSAEILWKRTLKFWYLTQIFQVTSITPIFWPRTGTGEFFLSTQKCLENAQEWILLFSFGLLNFLTFSPREELPGHPVALEQGNIINVVTVTSKLESIKVTHWAD